MLVVFEELTPLRTEAGPAVARDPVEGHRERRACSAF